MRICIFGASGRELDARYYAEAEAVGRLIGENGDSIVFGGGAEGLMGACARGVSAAGGDVVGIAPRFFDEPGLAVNKPYRALVACVDALSAAVALFLVYLNNSSYHLHCLQLIFTLQHYDIPGVKLAV